MHSKEFEDKLYDMLMPAFKARYKVVRRVDRNFYKSQIGEADLLSMALISHRVRKHFTSHPITKEELNKAYTYEENADTFYDEGSKILSLSHEFKYPVEYEKLNKQLMALFDLFAQDAGLDPLYNAFDLKNANPPIDQNACIKDWEGMKKSALLSAPVPAYELGVRKVPEQEILPEFLNAFCNEQIQYNQNRTERKAIELAVYQANQLKTESY
ncbi:MAG: hypothetical protein IJ870_05960 [Alphaproteobacteria bacterium]|nr:hypothetical protein [Alphaproteobacteria bacterium]